MDQIRKGDVSNRLIRSSVADPLRGNPTLRPAGVVSQWGERTMVWIITFSVLLLLLLPAQGHTQGTLEDISIYSPSLGMNRLLGVYTPAGYDPEGDERYPVVYFLHGENYGYSIYWGSWGQMKTSLDNLIGTQQISPMIVVTPDGTGPPFGSGYWTNSELYGNFEDYVFEDVVAAIDSLYRTIPTQSFRSLQGLSMGGYGSMKIALKHRELFRAAAAHSALLDLEAAVSLTADSVCAEYPEYPVGPLFIQP